jgi:hypothetical protein
MDLLIVHPGGVGFFARRMRERRDEIVGHCGSGVEVRASKLVLYTLCSSVFGWRYCIVVCEKERKGR